MEIKDNKHEMPLRHYGELLAGMDPGDVSKRTGVPYADGAFRTRLMNREISITYPDAQGTWTETGAPVKANTVILLLRLLVNGALAPATGRMASYAELPWGNAYLAAFNGRCVKRLAYAFANTPEKFTAACESLGGKPAAGSGLSYDIPFLPELTIRLTVWSAEEDFPPSAQILFSSNFSLAFDAEDLAYCGEILLDAMKGRF